MGFTSLIPSINAPVGCAELSQQDYYPSLCSLGWQNMEAGRP